jgi:hypothetical protein
MKGARISEENIIALLQFHEMMLEQDHLDNYNISMLEKVRVVRLHKKLMDFLPQYRTIDGVSNTWVVKPSYNARGVGIYLTKKLKDIMNLGKKI